MRITGGNWAGRRLGVPRRDVRPTSDRVRESLFAVLGDLSGSAVLDLCAGSGALGIEALSRGAASAVFVDRAVASVAQVRSNLEALEASEDAKVLKSDAVAAVQRLGRSGERFDLILLDPPYAGDVAGRALSEIAEAEILTLDGEVVVESDRRHPPGEFAGLRQTQERRYGDTLVTFYVSDATLRGPQGEESPPHE